jgi:flagellar hook-length control protein FliK
MQTVSPVVSAGAGGAPPGAAESAAADGVFPAAMTQAMSPSPGKAPPPAAGKALPVVPAEAVTVPSAALADTGGEGDAPAQSMPSGVVPALDGEPPAAVQARLPRVTDALQDISAGRAAAPRAEAAGAQAADAETALSELPAPAGVRPQKPAGRRAADEPAVPSLPGMAVATDPMSPPAVRPPANPAPRAVAAEATAKAREQVAQRPAADQAHGLMAMEQAAASPAPLARPVSAAAGAAAAPTAAAVTTNAGVTERVLTADSPLPVTGMDAGPVATPALAPAGVGVPAPAPAPAATVQVPEFSLAATPGSAQFGPQLGDRVLWLVHEGMHEARLQLNPRELGPVEVRLSVGDGAAQVSFSAQHAGTAAAVQQSLPQLRDLLAQQGLQLGQASVFHQPAGDGDAGRQQQAASGQSGWHGGGGQGPELDDTLPALPARLLGRGLVDAYA